jgi:predicted alpha/beta-fold hydrolase
LRNGHVQTVLARQLRPESLAVRLEQPVLLDAGMDVTGADPAGSVRLLGYYNAPLRQTGPRGLVLLLHGWEGSSHSPDVRMSADALLKAGYAVFRLNLRDHGPNLHYDRYSLNPGLFLPTYFEEVECAVRQIALLAGDRPFTIVGGSMGGNFALRLGLAHRERPIRQLTRIVALCPLVNPSASVRIIDSNPAYREFFRQRWLHSLKAKQRLFPDLHDFTAAYRRTHLMAITEHVVPLKSPWQGVEEYFSHYTVGSDDMRRLDVPTTIIAARDDLIIPVRDIEAFAESDVLRVFIHPTGGHMGFVDLLPYRRWLPDAVVAEVNRR